MRLKRNRKFESGFSILEVIFATSIVLTSVYAGFSGIRYLNRYIAAKREYSRETSLVVTVMQTIAANPAKFYVQDEFLTAGKSASSLINPYWAYSNEYFGPVTECPKCPNRIGTAVEAIPNNPRAYQVTVRVMRNRKKPATAAVAADAVPGTVPTEEFAKVKDYKSLVTF